MSPAQLVTLALQVSIALIVFAVALQAKPGDIGYLLRRPSLLLRSVLAMNVVMPIIAAAIAAAFNLNPAVEVALILLAVSPVPPILPGKEVKAGANISYRIGLLAVSAILAIVAVPLSVMVIGRLFGRDLQVPFATIAPVVAKTVLVPLLLGAIVRSIAPALARLASPITKIAAIILLLGLVLILATMWKGIAAAVGDFTLVAIVLFVLVSLAVGHLLGGPEYDDRTVLGLSTASRHPGVAVATAGAIATSAEEKGAVAAAILLCVLVGAVVTTPYVKLRKHGPRVTGTPPLGQPAG